MAKRYILATLSMRQIENLKGRKGAIVRVLSSAYNTNDTAMQEAHKLLEQYVREYDLDFKVVNTMEEANA